MLRHRGWYEYCVQSCVCVWSSSVEVILFVSGMVFGGVYA